MTVSHRVVSVIILLFFALTALLALIYFIGWAPADFYMDLWEKLEGNLWAAGLAILVFIASIWAITPFFVKASPLHTTIHTDEGGEISVALSAIEGLVQRLVTNQKGIKEAKTTVEPDDGYLKVKLRLSVSSDVAIPSLNVHLQDMIKEHVAQATGVTISRVEIRVERIELGVTKEIE